MKTIKINIFLFLTIMFIMENLYANEAINSKNIEEKDSIDKLNELFFKETYPDTETVLSGDQIRAFYIADAFFTKYIIRKVFKENKKFIRVKECYIKKSNDCIYLTNMYYSFARNETHYIVRISDKNLEEVIIYDSDDIAKCKRKSKNNIFSCPNKTFPLDGNITHEIYVNRITFVVDDYKKYMTDFGGNLNPIIKDK